MRIYRLENLEGQGVYSRGFAHNNTRAALEWKMDTLYHPSPCEEPRLKSWWLGERLPRKRQRDWKFASNSERNLWRCGFASLEQLTHWFPKEGLENIQRLAARHGDGMALVVYEVPHHKTKAGDAQTIYRVDHAVPVERISLEDLVATL